MAEIKKLKGSVIKKLFAKGSKSESQQCFLETGEEQYVLRFPEENPFDMNLFEKYINNQVEVSGNTEDQYLFIKKIKVLKK